METLPARGVNPVIDRFLQGYEGSAVMVNPKGLEILASDKRIAVSGWIMAVVLPTQEAFAPIVALQQRMLAATLLVTLLAGVLAAWMLRQQLAPVREAALLLRDLSDGSLPLLPLPIRVHDEIGQLIAAFNQLIASLAQRERALAESEAFKNGILNSVEAEIAVVDRHGVILAVNDAWRRFGADNDATDPASRSDIGSNYLAAGAGANEPVAPQTLDATQGILAVLQGRLPSFTVDYPCHSPQQLRWFRMSVTPLGHGDIQGASITHTDISALKQAQHHEHFRNHVLELLTQGAPLPAVLQAIVQGVEQLHPGMLCSVLRLDPDGQHLGRVVAPSLPDFYNQAVNGLSVAKDAGSCAATAFSGRRVIVADISLHSNWEAGRDLAARAGLSACWSEPIRSSGQQVIGVFAIYHRSAREPQAPDLLLMEWCARLAGLAIERSLAADVLRASEERFRNLIAWTREAIVVHRNGQIIFVNRVAVDLLGAASEGDLLGRRAMDFVHPDFHPTVHQRLSSLTTLNSATELAEQVYVKCDGSLIRVEVQGTLVHFDGAPAVQVGMRDITAQHAAQQELRIAAIAFECQEAIMVMDAQRRVLRVNRAFTRTTGYAQHEIEGRTNDMMRSERRPTVGDADTWQLMDQAGTFQGELWHRRKDGSDYLARGGATVLRDDHDRVTHYVSIFVDGSAEQQRERQRLLDEADHRNALVREVHHRIKNNLQGVIGMLHRSARNHPELTVAMQQAISQVHAISVTYGLQGRAITSAVLLDELVRAIARENQLFWQNPVLIELSGDWPACTIAQDEAVPIALVLNELILNALKHGPQTKGQVDIQLQPAERAGAVQVRISNTGLFPSERKNGGRHYGLQLVAALMPRRGANLLRMQRGDQVLTVLELEPPVLAALHTQARSERDSLTVQA
jgi:PAS domain S-box-containing protein